MEDHCAECGYDGRDLEMDEVSSQLRRIPEQVRTLTHSAPDAALRRRPDPSTWSAIEYLGHLRDLMAWHRFLIEQGVEVDRPTVPPVDPDASVASAGYADADLDDLQGQFTRRVERLCARIDSLEPAQTTRVIEWYGGREIDVQLVARSALHEGLHHIGDLERILARAHSATSPTADAGSVRTATVTDEA